MKATVLTPEQRATLFMEELKKLCFEHGITECAITFTEGQGKHFNGIHQLKFNKMTYCFNVYRAVKDSLEQIGPRSGRIIL